MVGLRIEGHCSRIPTERHLKPERRLRLSNRTSQFTIPCPMYFTLERHESATVLRLSSPECDDGTNRLTRARVISLTSAIAELGAEQEIQPLIITGNHRFFSAGADLDEIAALTGPTAYEFAAIGQRLMNIVAAYPAATFAAVEGYCMGGGLDLALACRHRVAGPHAVFGHRGVALGLITGWGGTQRLPRLIGKARALEMFVAAEKVTAKQALRIGLVEAVVEDPVAHCLRRIEHCELSAGSGQ
jgi:enoyl-CoA hydratase/carnithine racemase